MTLSDIKYRLEAIKRDADNALDALEALSNKEDSRSKLPEVINAAIVMKHYTLHGPNDLYLGIKSGLYPKPITSPKCRRLWRREDWDSWSRQTKQNAD